MKTAIPSLLLAAALCASGCGAPAASPTSADTCPLLDAGPPPACPEGCAWDGKECRRLGGVIIHYAKPDGGAPR